MSARVAAAFVLGMAVGLVLAERLDTRSLRAQVMAMAEDLRDRYVPADPDLENPDRADRDYIPPHLADDGYR